MALIVIASLASLPGIGSAAEGSRTTARVLDTQGGLPVPNATVELDRAGA
ncbi:MAG: hypothetical protein JO160_00295, partial [Candidatus Eremiobacteraeota bacterium]|nr:hypothetical protein [Candidatus Eremiobacteraeota bacterium]